jgi:hypothetical protein
MIVGGGRRWWAVGAMGNVEGLSHREVVVGDDGS